MSLWFAYRINILKSGYHLEDDHEIYRIQSDIQKDGFLGTLFSWIHKDFRIRFRPVYYAFRVCETALVGSNMFLWHIVQAIEIGICNFFLYVLARKLGCNSLLSAVFSFIIFCGQQSEIIWRLGPQETLGLSLLALSYICVINYHKKTNKRNLIVLMAVTLLLAGIKESFLLIVPSEILLLIYLEWVMSDADFTKQAVINFIKKHCIFMIYDFVLTLICVAVIVFGIGTNKIGYVGIDTSYTVADYVYALIGVMIQFAVYLTIIANMFLFFVVPVLAISIKRHDLSRRKIAKLIYNIFFLMYFLGTQMFLHCKSGMGGRYFVPAVFGVYFFLIIMINQYISECGYKGWRRKLFYAVLGISLMAVFERSDIGNSAKAYAQDGEETTEFLSKIKEVSDGLDSGDDSKILVFIGSTFGGEQNYSASAYLEIKYGLRDVYAVNYSNSGDGNYNDVYAASGQDRSICIDDVEIFAGMENDIDAFLEEKGLDTESLYRYSAGKYCIYSR